MQTNLINLLTEILTISQYSSDKEAFIQEFWSMNTLEATLNLYDNLSKETQQVIKQSNFNTDVILQYVSQNEFEQEVITVTQNEIFNLLNQIRDRLTSSQKEKIRQLFPQEIGLRLFL